jgi:hypothetical protein
MILPSKMSLSGLIEFSKTLEARLAGEPLRVDFNQWTNVKVEECLETNTCLTSKDIPTLLELLQSRGKDWFLSRYVFRTR